MTEPAQRRHILLLAIAFEGGLVALAILLGWLWDRPTWGLIRPSWSGFLWGLAATLPLLPVLLWLSHSKWGPLQRLMAEIDEFIAPVFARSTLLDLAVIALLAGLGEELLFRGLIQTGLTDLAGTGVALMVTSLLFGLLHWVTRAYAVLAALFGVYLGGLLVVSGDIMAPIVTHALYDVVALRYLRTRGRMLPQLMLSKKSLPLSSTRMNAGKSTTSIL
ncbi:MAG: CPBP family intramembrane metalloprotease [Gemmatimonadota bacterium]|nr:MAG: CPBP family intramembrane metalloprotease [Gemmatimonadota bacterium]